MPVLALKDDFKLRESKGWLRVSNFTPQSGIGHFDAAYDPTAGELLITVRLHFSFYTHKQSLEQLHATKKKDTPGYVVPDLAGVADGPKWSASEIAGYKRRFKEIQEGVWSHQYRFVSKKVDWREYSARVRVVVDTEAARGNSHYRIRVFKSPPDGKGRAMISHSPEWDGIFYENDLELENDKKRDTAYMLYAMKWLDSVIAKTGCDFIAFDKGSTQLTALAERKIGLFAVSGARYFNATTESAGLKIWVYSQTGPGELFVKPTERSKAIANKLLEYLRPHVGLVEVVPKFSKQNWIDNYVKRNLTRLESGPSASAIAKREFQGGMLIVKNYVEDSNLIQEAPGLPRNYIVAAHEFGHVLGNPDEYQGICCNALQNQIAKWQPVAPVKVNVDNERLTKQHEGISKLIKAADVPAPFYGSGAGMVTESIMYAGAQVLPAHYAPFWEALLNCTWPFLLAGDWKIEPDAPNNFKQMY